MVDMHNKSKIQFESHQVVPIASMMLICIFAALYVSAAGTNGSGADLWIQNHCFSAPKAAAMWSESMTLLFAGLKGTSSAFTLLSQRLGDLVSACFMASFSSADRYQVVVACYFMWVFGASMEQRLGFARFFMLVLMAVIMPWFLVGWFEASRSPDATFYGPCFLLSTLVGATFVFPPEKKINTNWFKSARGDIFAKPEERDMMAKYQFKPMLFLTLFTIAMVAEYFYNVGFMQYIPAFHSGLKTVSLPAVAGAVLLGYVSVSVLVWSATGSLKDGPMRLVTVKMYNDILKLDVGHEMAIRGTANALGLPPERVKEWVMQQKGKMRVS